MLLTSTKDLEDPPWLWFGQLVAQFCLRISTPGQGHHHQALMKPPCSNMAIPLSIVKCHSISLLLLLLMPHLLLLILSCQFTPLSTLISSLQVVALAL